MKKLIFIFCLVFLSSFKMYAQSETNLDSTTLSSKTKMELTQIYLDQVKHLLTLIPYTTFSLKDSIDVVETEKVDLDLPKTKYTTKKLDKVTRYTENMNSTIQMSLFEIVPYSDKKDIIRAILYVQSINQMMKPVF